MFKYNRAVKIVGVLLAFLLIFGCAPPREKPNDEKTNTDGSEAMDRALSYLDKAGLSLNLDDISSLAEDNPDGVSNLLPEINEVVGNGADIDNAIDQLEQTLDEINDKESFEAAYVHLYTGYAYILSAVDELMDTTNTDLAGAIIKDANNEYQFDTTILDPGGDNILAPAEVNADSALANQEVQSLINAVYILTGESYSPPAGQGWTATGPDSGTQANESNALEHLQESVSLIGTILPDSDPAELEQLEADINGGLSTDITTTIEGWGFTLN